MQTGFEFTTMLNYVLAKEKEADMHKQKVDGIGVFAKIIAIRIVENLDKNVNADIQDLFENLDMLLEDDMAHVAIQIVSHLFQLFELAEISDLINGFILNQEWEETFLEILIEFGTDYYFFKSIGLE